MAVPSYFLFLNFTWDLIHSDMCTKSFDVKPFAAVGCATRRSSLLYLLNYYKSGTIC